MLSFIHTRRIAFHETDAAGIVHFSRMLCLVEEAEHAALESVGIPVYSAEVGWPRVKLEVNYESPLKGGALAEVKVFVLNLGRSSVSWGFTISSMEQIVAEGTMMTVRVGSEGEAEDLSCWRELFDSALEGDVE